MLDNYKKSSNINNISLELFSPTYQYVQVLSGSSL